MPSIAKIAVSIILLAGIASLGFSFVPASRVYTVGAGFTSLPESDDKLQDWLREQPGVVDHTVHITRGQDQTLELTFIITQNTWKTPPFPDIETKCDELGYELSSRFTDVR